MVETNDRILPVGIQSFEKIRKEGYFYVDKTDIIWQLANRNKTYNYLSRPRRFGKSVLVDTLEAYFMGKKELFEGLKIMQMETEWVKRPVIRLDMSRAGAEPGTLRSYLDNAFRQYEKEYSLVPDPTDSLADRFDAIIQTAYNKTGLQVAILIDEYDSPLQHSWKTPQHEACTAIYREVFAVLKSQDKYEKFVFITGITKFTQISLFSVLNNLSNISFEPEYAAICGITKEELLRDFKPEINKLAEYEGWTFDEAVAQLTAYYDGYHFCEESEDIYNPFSLIKSLNEKRFGSYWFDTGTPTYLIERLRKNPIDETTLDNIPLVPQSDFDVSPEISENSLPMLYQTGYLTIKSYDERMQLYTLGYPNKEVRSGFLDSLLAGYNGNNPSGASFVIRFNAALRKGDIDEALSRMQSFLAGMPNDLENKTEKHYQTIIYLIFSLLGYHIRTEEKSAVGRADAVCWTQDSIYVFEFKVDSTAETALKQIDDKGYMIPYRFEDGKRLVKIGVNISTMTRTIDGWVVDFCS